ncbi:MAG TPA: hypothetical protein VN708_20905 [Terriglobales bacterium]|jgi:hypothetical protein|nr:hypothetical protein [Terriglobales bacterium]
MKKKSPERNGHLNYETVPTARLRRSRKGKHHDLMLTIMEDLRQSRPGFAVKIPLSSTEGVPVVNLRSVIVRTAAKENIRVATSSDDEYFYVWRP